MIEDPTGAKLIRSRHPLGAEIVIAIEPDVDLDYAAAHLHVIANLLESGQLTELESVTLEIGF